MIKCKHVLLAARVLSILLVSLAASACSGALTRNVANSEDDRYLWLEEIQGKNALEWVGEKSKVTLDQLTKDSRYPETKAKIGAILTAKDRLPVVSLRNGWYYNFWQDVRNPKGLWRRTREAEFEKADPNWEVILDFDLLSKQENESWVYKGAQCLAPENERCLLSLSRGGKDAIVIREFDLKSKTFLKDGFNHLQEAKSQAAWVDQNHVLIGSDWGPGSLTDSGYPRQVKLWERGKPASAGSQIYEAEVSDMAADPTTFQRPEGNITFIDRRINFYERELFRFDPATASVAKVPVPNDSEIAGVINGILLLTLRTDWKTPDGTFTAGSLVALSGTSGTMTPTAHVSTVFAPQATQSIGQVAVSKTRVYLKLLQNVSSKVLEFQLQGSTWRFREVMVPEYSSINITSYDSHHNKAMVSVEGFLQPPTLAVIEKNRLRVLKTTPARFDSSDMVSEQNFAVSRDGTRIPYFLIRKKTASPGTQPVLMYGYGGFEISNSPFYLSTWGKVWLENGGAFVLSNIRGGGEFGPAWHQAAILKNKQKSYDDFIAIAEDLITRKVTSSRQLGIMGGSNGGLLVSAVLVQRPDLFNAVICQVPLTDMLRYHKLLAGASWMAEYGNPEDPEMYPFIRAYSPYQNVRENVRYPSILIHTSTNDDRVHPGHARKLAARLGEVAAPVLYYENTEGGHSAAADLEQRVKIKTLEMIYLMKQLF
ncbi:MAG: hypothetical protein A2X94_11730 [Bdellovibrionales bacterium GWB1_55_8]|nr:MAG: hypothetical protein A2X94_11730 [Bdellovibrionales bacterium GWB1_55_8]